MPEKITLVSFTLLISPEPKRTKGLNWATGDGKQHKGRFSLSFIDQLLLALSMKNKAQTHTISQEITAVCFSASLYSPALMKGKIGIINTAPSTRNITYEMLINYSILRFGVSKICFVLLLFWKWSLLLTKKICTL